MGINFIDNVLDHKNPLKSFFFFTILRCRYVSIQKIKKWHRSRLIGFLTKQSEIAKAVTHALYITYAESERSGAKCSNRLVFLNAIFVPHFS